MSKFIQALLLMLLCFGMFSSAAYATAVEGVSSIQQSAEVMEQFNEDGELAPERAISIKKKHQILFLMGSCLLILILVAASFGIAMGVFGKDVFVWHMLSAGLATTLAIAHAVTAFVWFYPES
ncbi:MAG: hypothetical protein R8K49_07775 [Mariprofundaceae bacterium]